MDGRLGDHPRHRGDHVAVSDEGVHVHWLSLGYPVAQVIGITGLHYQLGNSMALDTCIHGRRIGTVRHHLSNDVLTNSFWPGCDKPAD